MTQEKPPTEMDFGELVNSEKFTAAMLKLNVNLDATKAQLEAIAKCDVQKLSTKDQVMLDLYMAYAVNSLYWMFLRTKGINPATHAIKSEINRVREYAGRANKVWNRKAPTTRVNKEAAKRFIRSGLWTPGEKPKGGVVKKFDSTNMEVQASSSSSETNEKGAEVDQFKAPNASSEGVVKSFDSISVGDVNVSTSFNKPNKKGRETASRKPEGGVKKLSPSNAGAVKAQPSFSQVNKKGDETKQFKSPKGNAGDFKKLNSTNVQASSSLSQANKKGNKTKQFKSPNGNAGDFKKLNSTNVQASSSFKQVNKKSDETKQFKFLIGKTGKKSNHKIHIKISKAKS